MEAPTIACYMSKLKQKDVPRRTRGRWALGGRKVIWTSWEDRHVLEGSSTPQRVRSRRCCSCSVDCVAGQAMQHQIPSWVQTLMKELLASWQLSLVSSWPTTSSTQTQRFLLVGKPTPTMIGVALGKNGPMMVGISWRRISRSTIGPESELPELLQGEDDDRSYGHDANRRSPRSNTSTS